MLKRITSIMCIIPFLIPTTYNTHSYSTFRMAKVDKVDIELNGINRITNEIEKGILPYKNATITKMLNEMSYGLINQQQEKARQEEIKREEEANTVDFILTFYTSLDCENGYGAITCTGKKLTDGMVANNVYKLGTTIKLDGFGKVTVADRGSNKFFNNETRLDVFIPRDGNESDYNYKRRVNKMGKVIVKGRIIK